MEQSTIQGMVPQVHEVDANPNPDAAALALTGDNKTDLAAIAKEMGVQLDAQGNVVEQAPTPAQVPAQPQAAQPARAAQGQPPAVEQPAPQEIPKKFQNPDGSLNAERLDKSTKSAEEMIAYFKAKEREAQQLQNKANNPPPQATQQAQVQPPAGMTPLEIQVAQDILDATASLIAQGYQPAQAQALATARINVRLQEARYGAELSATEEIRRELKDSRMSIELQGLLDSDKSLLDPNVADRIIEIKQQRGLKNYRDAYIVHLGEQEFQKRAPQVQTPNPTGQAAKAPPTPVGPVTRVLPSVDITDRKALEIMDLDKLEALAKQTVPGFRGGSRY